MAKLSAFEQVSLDGYFADADGQIAWAHKSDPEWDEFVAQNAGSGGVLVFGRTTYEMMLSYWPTPQAAKDQPSVAKGMNAAKKVVFSHTLGEATWENTTVVKGDVGAELRRLKKESDSDIVILGSGSVVVQAAQAGVIDAYTLVVNPVVLGAGKPLFRDVKLTLKPPTARTFRNGNVLLKYE